jgi:DNA polymerase V
MKMYALVDCNNFFASCERIFRPDLVGKPVAVLSNNDGCIVARSQEVRALDIPMGAPLFQVKDIVRVNNVTLFSANFELYGDISQRIVSVLREITPLIEVYSIDESFIDLSELHIDDYDEWARNLRDRIFREIGTPVSVGVAGTKTLAKVAGTYAKTHGDGTYVINNDEQRRVLLADLPIQDIWGVGWRMAPKLRDRGVSKAIQLTEASDVWLKTQFNITGLKMVDELRGQPRLSFGDKSDQRQTIMRSRSFGHRVRAYHQLESAVATFTAQSAAKLRAQGSVCRGIMPFLSGGKREGEARLWASQLVTLDEATADTGKLITAALQGLNAIYDVEGSYKKAGVTLVGIQSQEAWQLSLLHGQGGRDESVKLMQAVDTLNKRYGSSTIWHASEARQQATWQSKREHRSPRYTTNIAELPLLHK